MYRTILKTIKENWLYADEYDYEKDISAIFYGINKRDKYAKVISVCKNASKNNITNAKFNIVNNFLYCKITYINQRSIDELTENIEKHSSICSTILDLRNCIGGDLMQTIRMMDIIYGRYQFCLVKKDGKELFINNHSSKFSKIVLLVGKGTISAAELVTGIGLNNNKTVVIGSESTFGKNTVQKTWSLDDNTIYELTVARFEFEGFTSSGNGLNPNITVNRFIDEDYIELNNISSYCISDISINIMKIQLILEKLCGVKFDNYGMLNDEIFSVLNNYMGITSKYLSIQDIQLILDRYNKYFYGYLNDRQFEYAKNLLSESEI